MFKGWVRLRGLFWYILMIYEGDFTVLGAVGVTVPITKR